MPTLKELRQNAARVEVVYGDSTIILYYRPHLLTPDTQKVLSGATTRGGLDPLIAEFKRLMVWWDVTDDDGEMIPFDPEPLHQIGVGLIGNIINAMVQDVLNPTWASPPVQARLTPYSNGSSPVVRLDPVPITINSSEQLSGQESRPGFSEGSMTEEPVSSGIPG